MIRFIAATLIATLSTAPATAHPNDTAVRMQVGYADLNLASPQGAARLARRIRFAARTACRTGSGGLLTAHSERLCRRDMEARANRQLALARPLNPAIRIASAR